MLYNGVSITTPIFLLAGQAKRMVITLHYLRRYYKNCVKFVKEINYWLDLETKVFAILGSFNSPAFYPHLGALLNLGISIGIYPTSSS